MTLTQAREIYRQAIKAADPSETGLTVGSVNEIKKLAKLLAYVGGFELWEIEEKRP